MKATPRQPAKSSKTKVHEAQGHSTLVAPKKFNKIEFGVIAVVAITLGAFAISRIYAAAGSLTAVPSATTVSIGSTVTVTVRENSGTDTVNGVQANLTYDATKLQYVSVDNTTSPFTDAQSSASNGTLTLGRYTGPGVVAVSGDQVVTVVTFKALVAGPVAINFDTASQLIRSTDDVDILTVKTGTNLTVGDYTAPAVPTGVTASGITLTSMNLAWTASTDNVAVTGYRIYRGGTQIGTSTATTYSDANLTPGTQYSYTVAAVDAAGNVSATSTAITPSTIPDTAAPTVPGKPTSPSQTMTSVNLAWTASTDNVAVAGYRIYRNGTQVATGTALSYVDTGLAVNTSYSYTIAAYDAAGNTSAQTLATAVKTLPDTAVPSVPQNLGASVSGTTVNLTWTAATDNIGVSSYLIYRDGVQIATSATVSYSVTSAPSGSHVYTVAAADAANNTSAQSTGVTVVVSVPGDVNGDGHVTIIDLSTVLTNYAKSGTRAQGDLNGDGVVNIVDLSTVLTHYGT
jgi:chitodextrinase